MSHPTDTESTPASPRAIGWCSWHKGMAEDVRLIQAVEQGSGPGMSFFACPRCRDKFSLPLLADQP